jgi:hypothetical protein
MYKGGVLACALILGSAMASVAGAQSVTRLGSSDHGTGDNLGHDVDIYGDWMIAGAPGHDHNGDGSGAAYVFKMAGSGWSENAELLPSDSVAGDSVGAFDSVATDGAYAVVGGIGHSSAGANAGAAWVFQNTGSGWTETQKLLPGSVVAGERFGWSVDVDGQWMIVGAPQGLKGECYIYRNTGSGFVPFQMIVSSDQVFGSRFGYSVEIDGDRLIVGDWTGVGGLGGAYVFDFDGTTWNETVKLAVADAGPRPRFGLSVSLDGDNAVVGAFGDLVNGERSGSAYAFSRSTGTWMQTAKFVPDDGAAEDSFGQEVAVSGDVIVVGAHQHYGHSNYGAAYVYRDFGAGWVFEEELVGPGRFGAAVDVDAGEIVVSAETEENKGFLYIVEVLSEEPDARELVKVTREKIEKLDIENGKKRELVRRLDTTDRQLERVTDSGHRSAEKVVDGMIKEVDRTADRLIDEDSKEKIKVELVKVKEQIKKERLELAG